MYTIFSSNYSHKTLKKNEAAAAKTKAYLISTKKLMFIKIIVINTYPKFNAISFKTVNSSTYWP